MKKNQKVAASNTQGKIAVFDYSGIETLLTDAIHSCMNECKLTSDTVKLLESATKNRNKLAKEIALAFFAHPVATHYIAMVDGEAEYMASVLGDNLFSYDSSKDSVSIVFVHGKQYMKENRGKFVSDIQDDMPCVYYSATFSLYEQ